MVVKDDDDAYEWHEVDLRKVAAAQMAEAETTGVLRLTRLQLVRMPRSLQYLPHLQHIDLSHNGLTRLPGQWLLRSFPTLRVLSVAANCLHVLDDVLHLSRLHHLAELDLSANPLPLVTNRVYLLEALFQASWPRDFVAATTQDARALCSVPDKTRCPTVYLARHPAPVPRREGFPMLQTLNGASIVLEDVAAVERELGRKLRYPVHPVASKTMMAAASRHLGQRKTAKELERRQQGFKTLPAVRSVPHLQYTVDQLPKPVDTDADDNDGGWDGGMTMQECNAARRDIKLGLAVDRTVGASAPVEPVADVHDTTGWNQSIASLDFVQNDQRCVIREKSKSDTTLRDDPLESDVLLDSMVQAERSRRLTQRTLDVLTNVGETDVPAGHFDIYGDTGEVLLDKLNHNHTREIVQSNYEVVTQAFCRKTFPVGTRLLTPDFRDVIELEFHATKCRNNALLANCEPVPPALVDTIDLSLRWVRDTLHSAVRLASSRMRAQNRIEGVINKINPKHEKRLIQALIDSDQQVVDEQLRRQKIKEHKDRMAAIAHRGQRPKSATAAKPNVSSWQQRNIVAVAMKEQGIPVGVRRRAPNDPRQAFKSIETVEEAAGDHLLGVSSKELLVRCAEIRKHARESLKDLACAKDDFVATEFEWESKRRDAIELLKRKVRASACDGTEIMIGNQEFIYSSF
ncbi:hypothetical protein ACHHYP_08008 [Achlya hypogyna]|uniref:Leucine-rich repeat-containing protein n=1 Tax=Achlya hypogyna TaxID=1202772 RepID=A0A1V9YQ05_ACHHY|nr:hypothetical protein ACHHYP_08008 [Achlya hypogyna]